MYLPHAHRYARDTLCEKVSERIMETGRERERVRKMWMEKTRWGGCSWVESLIGCVFIYRPILPGAPASPFH